MKSMITMLAITCLAAGTNAWAADEEVAADQVPAPVMAALVKAANGAKLGNFERETEDGKVVYTAEFKDAQGKEQEVTVAADGTLIGVEAEDADDQDDGDEDDKDDDDKDDKDDDTK